MMPPYGGKPPTLVSIFVSHARVYLCEWIYLCFRFKKGAYMSFMWKKVKRLFILYLMASLIVVSIKLITQGEAYVEHPVTPTTYLEIFYLPAVGYYLWFV